MSHSFVDANFSKPNYCDHCQGLLWGFIKQGVKCSACEAVCHHECQNAIATCKNAKEQPTEQHTTYPESLAQKSLRTTLQQHIIDSSPLSPPLPSPSTIESSSNSSPFQKLKKMATSEEFQNVLVSAAIHSSDTDQPANAYLANLPPLNPQNTAKNFSRFVSRCGPMFAFRDSVILLLSWNKPTDTLAALLIYCIICLHPKLILLVPHTILLLMIISGYNKQFTMSTTVRDQQDEDTPHSSNMRRQSGSFSASSVNNNNTRKRFSFASAFFPAFDESSPEYLKNMRNLQNMMGEMSDLYDLVKSKAHFIDWSSETDTMRLFQLSLFSFLLLSFFLYFIPLNLIALVSGALLFLLNTRFMKYVMKEMWPHVAAAEMTTMASDLFQWYTQMEKRMLEEEDQAAVYKEVSLFENQRWWSGSGFMPHMMSEERGLWTDISGSVEFGPKEELPAPTGYRWVESNWSLDIAGPWVDDALGLEVMVKPENGGWVYTDDNWENPRSEGEKGNNENEKDTARSFTRRRRWIRKCERNLSSVMKYSLSDVQ